MNSHNVLYTNGQSSENLDGMEQGTWQPPTQNTYGQGAVYYNTGAPQRYFNQNQSESWSNGDASFNVNNAPHTTNSGMAKYTYDRNVGQHQTNSYMGLDLDNSNSSSATVCNSGYNYNNSCYYNYGYSSEDSSYNTSGNNTGMEQTATSSTDIPGFSGFQKSTASYSEYNYNGMHSGRGGLGGSCVSDNNNNMGCIGVMNDGGNDRKSRNHMDDRKSSGSFHGERDVREAPVHFSHFQNSASLSSSSRGHHYKMRQGDFSGGRHMTSGNFGWRGRGSSRGHLNKSEPYHPNNRHNFITLNARHKNQWGYLRKYFNKSDDELAEHLFEIHDLFCTKCQQREQERKTNNGNTGKSQDKDPNEDADNSITGEKAEEETPEEELTEEELQMRNVMGFSGFKSTKGSRLKDNTFETVSSVNQSKSDLQETSSLTEEEKKRILSIGGYSVFSKRSCGRKPEFGAPAVTMDPLANQE